MSQRDAMRALDAEIHAAMADADLAELGNYLPPDSAPDAVVIVCRVYVDRGVQTLGDYGQVVGRRDEVTFLREDVMPTVRGTVEIDGTTYKLADLLDENDSTCRWAVRP